MERTPPNQIEQSIRVARRVLRGVNDRLDSEALRDVIAHLSIAVKVCESQRHIDTSPLTNEEIGGQILNGLPGEKYDPADLMPWATRVGRRAREILASEPVEPANQIPLRDFILDMPEAELREILGERRFEDLASQGRAAAERALAAVAPPAIRLPKLDEMKSKEGAAFNRAIAEVRRLNFCATFIEDAT